MKHSLILGAALFACAAMPAQAQLVGGNSGNGSNSEIAPYNRFSVGFEALMLGGKTSGAYLIDPDAKADDGMTMPGFTLQFLHGFSISETRPMYIETGLKLAMNFKSQTFDDWDSDIFEEAGIELKASNMALSFAVPVNFVYNFPVAENVSIAPYTGFTFKFNALSKYKVKFEANDEDDAEYLNKYYFDDKDGRDVSCLSKDDLGKDGQWKFFQAGWQLGCGVKFNKYYLGLEYGLDFVDLYKKTHTSHFDINLGYTF